MRPIILFLFYLFSIGLGHTQNKPFTTFQDYLIAASNPVSLKNIDTNVNPSSSSQSLHLLIASELNKQNWDEPRDIQNTKQIGQMAAKQKLPIGLAITYLILGRHYSYEKEDSLSYYYLVKAEKIFTNNKDTTGMLYCYRQLRVSVDENYTDLAKQYFNKLIALSTKSSNPIDKYFYYLSVLSADPYFAKQPTENQMLGAFRGAIAIIDKYPYCEFMRRYIYHNLQQGYANLKKNDKVLEISLQTIQHPKISANYLDYQNLGRAYIRVKKYDEAIVVLEKAAREIKIERPTDFRRQRNIYKLLKTAYYNIDNLKAGVKADEEYDRLNEIIFESDRSLAMFHLKEKYSFTEKEAELKRISLEKQVAESRNQLLQAQYEAQKREAALKNLALENQAAESKAKLLQSEVEIQRKERTLQLAESQKELLLGGLLVALGLTGTTLAFSIKHRKTNKKLLELQQGRDKFYTIIAHDLRTPINSLNDMGGLLPHLIQEGKKQELDRVIQQIEYMREKTKLLLNNLFEWGKSQYFTPDVAEVGQQVDVVPLVEELYQTYLPIAQAQKIDLKAELPPSFITEIAPKGLLITVRNLLDNAIKNTPVGGEISVRINPPAVGKNTNNLTITITDTGNGIEPDQLHYLQQVFAGKVKPEVGIHGLGLGIILIHHFLQKSKTTLNVESEVGKGTSFKLSLKQKNKSDK